MNFDFRNKQTKRMPKKKFRNKRKCFISQWFESNRQTMISFEAKWCSRQKRRRRQWQEMENRFDFRLHCNVMIGWENDFSYFLVNDGTKTTVEIWQRKTIICRCLEAYFSSKTKRYLRQFSLSKKMKWQRWAIEMNPCTMEKSRRMNKTIERKKRQTNCEAQTMTKTM